MIRHHPEASLAPCDHPMWSIWGRDRHHHALTAHGRARKGRAVEWLPPLDLGQLWGRHVSPGLQHPPSGAGQLWGRHVSLWFQLPPPGSR
jgi:hypothetical protein